MLLLAVAGVQAARGQNVADPLLFQGIERIAGSGVRTQALGGTSVVLGSGSDAMFQNPANLIRLDAWEFRAGGYTSASRAGQVQNWTPNRFYADLSLMFENLSDTLKNPDPELVTNPAAENIHRRFDTLGPSWEKRITHTRPGTLSAGIPFSVAGISFAAGLGWSEVANLDQYYQNNNALDPNIGARRPQAIPLVPVGDTLRVQWYQFIRQRDGAMRGITPAAAISIMDNLSAGISATILSGNSDDAELRTDRGLLRFMNTIYYLDTARQHIESIGTSKYSGSTFSFGATYSTDEFGIGLVVRAPYTVTRDWDRTVTIDTAGVLTTNRISGTDKTKFPLSWTLGIVVHPVDRLQIGLDYDVRPNSDATFTASDGSASNPFLDTKAVRAGAEYQYRKWLALRFGVRQDVQSFAPAGAGIMNDPATGTTYSCGVGLKFKSFLVDAAYRYSTLEYQDLWESNVNYNAVRSSAGSIEIGYAF
jgi:hypothetical protein